MQVTRHRRPVGTQPRGRRIGRRSTLTAGATAVVLAVTAGIGYAQTRQFGTDQVGQVTDRGQVVSSDQYIAPYGDRLVLDNGKIMSSSVSPDGTHLAAAVTDGGSALAIVDVKNWKVQQVVGTAASSTPRLSSNSVGQEGPTYSPDGTQLWLGQTDGYTRFTVNSDGTVTNPTPVTIPADGSKRALVGQAVFSSDGSTVYAAVNGQNRVVAIDAATGAIKQSWPVGNAPRDMAIADGKLYVSNEGGRPAQSGDTTMNSYGTQVPADPQTGATTTGTVSVIDLADPAAAPTSIDVGLHPTALYAKGKALFVTNTATNDVSVIDTARDKVVQTISTKPWPEASVGYEPDAVTLTDDGHLLVTLGRANAVAVYRYRSPQEPVSYVGLLPTDYFPAEITTVGDQVLVSNTRGIDARRPNNPAGHGTHDTTSSVQRFTLPDDSVIRSETATVFRQNGWTPGSVKLAKGGGHSWPVPVPARLGDPSTIKHVFLIVKENRTYDQVFGDMSQGDGDPAVTQFGENVTPNQHALAEQFGLYDNTYDIGTNSAEGHNWLMQADDPEYTESSAGEYQRSYDTENDALGHQKSGFIWTGAQAAGKTVRDFGEFQSIESKPAGASWQNLYCDAKNMDATGQTTAYPCLLYTSKRQAQRRVGARIPDVRPRRPGHLQVPDLETGLREERAGEPEHVLALQRPHRWSGEPGGPGGGQRPRGRQDGRRDLAQQVLEGLGDLRRRGRLPGWPRPRRRPPRPDPDHQPLGPARHRRQPLLLPDHDDPDHRADPRDPPDEPEGQRGQPDDRGLHPAPGLHAVHRAAQPDLTDRRPEDPAHLRRGHPRSAGPQGGGRAGGQGAGGQAAARGRVGRLEVQAAPHRPPRRPRLRQPRADEPPHVVPDAQLGEAVPRGEEDLRAR